MSVLSNEHGILWKLSGKEAEPAAVCICVPVINHCFPFRYSKHQSSRREKTPKMETHPSPYHRCHPLNRVPKHHIQPFPFMEKKGWSSRVMQPSLRTFGEPERPWQDHKGWIQWGKMLRGGKGREDETTWVARVYYFQPAAVGHDNFNSTNI